MLTITHTLKKSTEEQWEKCDKLKKILTEKMWYIEEKRTESMVTCVGCRVGTHNCIKVGRYERTRGFM